MLRLRNTFEEVFGLPFSLLPLPPDGMRPLDGQPADESMLLGCGGPAVDQLPILEGGLQPGTWLVGFWGHGMNSYAFYYERSDAWSSVALRLAYGGVYMDNEHKAALIREFLGAYFRFEEVLRGLPVPAGGRSVAWHATDSMGAGRYTLRLPCGATHTVDRSLLSRPDFTGTFGAFLAAHRLAPGEDGELACPACEAAQQAGAAPAEAPAAPPPATPRSAPPFPARDRWVVARVVVPWLLLMLLSLVLLAKGLRP